MKNVEYQTKQLIRQIKKSNEYNQFHRLSARISSQPELKRQVDTYRRRRFVLQRSENGSSELWQMEKDCEELLAKPLVRDFLISEQKLMLMMQNTLLSITDAVGLDLEL